MPGCLRVCGGGGGHSCPQSKSTLLGPEMRGRSCSPGEATRRGEDTLTWPRKRAPGPCLFPVTIRTARIAGTVLDARAAALSVGWGAGEEVSTAREAHMTGGAWQGARAGPGESGKASRRKRWQRADLILAGSRMAAKWQRQCYGPRGRRERRDPAASGGTKLSPPEGGCRGGPRCECLSPLYS